MQAVGSVGDNLKDCLHKPAFHETACARQWKPTPFAPLPAPPAPAASPSPPAPPACKLWANSVRSKEVLDGFEQLAKFGDSLKDGLHKPTSLRCAPLVMLYQLCHAGRHHPGASKQCRRHELLALLSSTHQGGILLSLPSCWWLKTACMRQWKPTNSCTRSGTGASPCTSNLLGLAAHMVHPSRGWSYVGMRTL